MRARNKFNLKKFLIFTGLVVLILGSLAYGLTIGDSLGMRVEASTL